jgi:predicted Zn-dependent protease
LLWAPALAAQVQLPDIGSPESNTISLADERAIGELFMREIRSRVKLVDDAEVEDYIQSLGYRLLSQSDSQQFGFTFFVVEDAGINAFAAPGGYIGINSGLITASESEGEVASVVAHEIAHVTQRHIAQAVAVADRSSMQTLAGIIAAIIIGTQSPDAGQATAAAVIGSQIQKQLNFSRANEQEADRVGMQLLQGAGFDPRAMPVVHTSHHDVPDRGRDRARGKVSLPTARGQPLVSVRARKATRAHRAGSSKCR